MTKIINWTGLKNCTGLCALLLSFQVNSNELNIQDAWIRTLTPGQENAMVGMVVNSDRQARITVAISPAYKFVAMQGPGKSGAKKTREIEFIDLPANTPVVLGAESMHLLLSGNKKNLDAADKVPVIVTVKFDDNTRKTITIMAQPVNSKGEPVMPSGSNIADQASTVTPPPQPAPVPAKASPAKAANPAKPAVAPRKPPVAAVKPLKVSPDAVKLAPAPVAASVVAPPPAPVAAPVAVALPAAEPKKAPESKPAEQHGEDEAQANADCLSLAAELRECEKANDMMQEWCVSNAKSNYSCQLSMGQLKKLRSQQSR